jgi:CheY-like chemotaxis protein
LYEIQVAVRDTGIGIAPTQMERLFKSFSQVDTSITRKYGGTGMGLVISKNLAHMMGGTMWLESQLGVGSTFFFTFRSCIPNEASELPKPQKIDQPELTDTHLSISDLIGRRVLIVGDNETNRHIITRYIGVWGMLPTVVVSHHDALATLQHGSLFDAIVLDIHTAGQDDTDDIFQMAEELQQYAANPPIPVVLCTSLATKHEVLRTGSPPFVHIITRPIKPSHLYDALVGLMPDIDGITDNATDNATDSDTASDTLKHPAPAATSRQSTHTPLPQQIGQTPMSHSSNEEMRPDTPDNIDLRVLLVEDNAFNQKVALRFLDKLGYTADVANHGKEAVDRLHHTHYHIILMDVQMPEMDGFEATHHIRHSYPHPQQPYIIAMTAHAVSGDRERCIEAGMDEYISKPVKIEELRNALQHAIHTLHSQP